jgi:ribonuclease HI
MHAKLENFTKLIVFTDGGARGNPGEAAYGFVIFDQNNKIIHKEGKRIGTTTNNIAEYKAVIAALSWIIKNLLPIKNVNIEFFLDSNLLVQQLMGKYKVRDEKLRDLFFTVKELERRVEIKIEYRYIPREQNKEADRLVNLALEGAQLPGRNTVS